MIDVDTAESKFISSAQNYNQLSLILAPVDSIETGANLHLGRNLVLRPQRAKKRDITQWPVIGVG